MTSCPDLLDMGSGSWHDWYMTNNTDTDLTAAAINSIDRRLAAIRDLKETKIIMVPPSGRYYRPRTRRTSVKHRAIR